MSVSSRAARPTPSTKRGESRLPAEEWQLQILRELHQKQPHPSVEQRRLLATQTGLNAKWIANWFKKANSAPKKAEGLAKDAPSRPRVAATTINGSGHSAKSVGVAEPSSSGGSLSADAVANSFLSGGVRVSDSAKSTPSSHGGPQAWEHRTAASDLQANRESPAFCYPAALISTRPHPTVLYSQQGTGVNLLRTTPIYSTTSFQLASSLGSMIVQPADPRGPPTSSETTQLRDPYQDLGRQSPPALAYPEDSQRDPISTLVAARMHSGSSVLDSDPVVPQLSLGPLPSMYWFLFDKDDSSVEDASRSPSRLLGSADVTAAPRVANPTPISFLARWGDMLALERRIRSSFEANLRQVRQAQPLESGGLAKPDDQETFLIKSDHDLGESTPTCLDRPQSAGDAPDEQRLSPTSSLSSIFGEPCDEDIPLLSDTRVE
ncbi:hypothetical protein BJV78DRAFT_1206095 [Lactifluus subvellereus]|nr:hypothetical protein BJV78DRAFT_1206095 [Lactifluus subvellereus]